MIQNNLTENEFKTYMDSLEETYHNIFTQFVDRINLLEKENESLKTEIETIKSQIGLNEHK